MTNLRAWSFLALAQLAAALRDSKATFFADEEQATPVPSLEDMETRFQGLELKAAKVGLPGRPLVPSFVLPPKSISQNPTASLDERQLHFTISQNPKLKEEFEWEIVKTSNYAQRFARAKSEGVITEVYLPSSATKPLFSVKRVDRPGDHTDPVTFRVLQGNGKEVPQALFSVRRMKSTEEFHSYGIFRGDVGPSEWMKQPVLMHCSLTDIHFTCVPCKKGVDFQTCHKQVWVGDGYVQVFGDLEDDGNNQRWELTVFAGQDSALMMAFATIISQHSLLSHL